jgi:hypothetical protein
MIEVSHGGGVGVQDESTNDRELETNLRKT